MATLINTLEPVLMEMKNAYKILVGISECKRPLGISRDRWEDNIGVDITETGWEGVVWIHLAQNRYKLRALVNTVMNFRVP
jgi:hypothetical protein